MSESAKQMKSVGGAKSGQTGVSSGASDPQHNTSSVNANTDAITPQPQPHSSANELSINLSTLDKIKRFFFSKEEWEAYLIEKLEEEKRKKEGDFFPVKLCDDNDQKSVLSWIRTVFPSQEEANTFLKSQLDKLQSEQNEQMLANSAQVSSVEKTNR